MQRGAGGLASHADSRWQCPPNILVQLYAVIWFGDRISCSLNGLGCSVQLRMTLTNSYPDFLSAGVTGSPTFLSRHPKVSSLL